MRRGYEDDEPVARPQDFGPDDDLRPRWDLVVVGVSVAAVVAVLVWAVVT